LKCTVKKLAEERKKELEEIYKKNGVKYTAKGVVK